MATSGQDMNVPGWGLHPLSDALKAQWAVSITGNWPMTFTFEGTDTVLVDSMDYHLE
ncbi:MAG: type II toxin-antitoxin system RelE/ParE family toxin [Rhodoferax sp.]|nr:type II toxin-antitoxin system RelE/ParE family toxin [Rhodoferax sp.]